MIDREGIRKYLLGSATEDERESFEQDLLADDDLYEELLATEEELIDEYVAGALPEPEEVDLLRYLRRLPDYEKRLEFARALRADGVDSRIEFARSHALGRFPLRASWVAAAAAMILMVVGGIWSVATISELRRQVAAGGPQSFVLTAGTLRSGGTRQNVPLPNQPTLVEFRLDLGFDDYESYRAVLYDAQTVEIVSASQLKARIEGDQVVVKLGISSEQLEKGDFYISLMGTPRDGAPEPVARYDFRVVSD